MDRVQAGTRRWTAEDDQALRARYPHEPTAPLSRALRRSLRATYARARILGLAKSAAYMASPDACWLRRGTRPARGSDSRRATCQPTKAGAARAGTGGGCARRSFGRARPARGPCRSGTRGSRMATSTARSATRATCRGRKTGRSSITSCGRRRTGPCRRGILRFRDGDRTNTRLENLELLTRGALGRALMGRNTVHRLPPALVTTLQLLGALTRQINRRTTRDACSQQD